MAAFAPSNVVPGIGFSLDKMLQARVFSYADAHRYRLGTHYEALPGPGARCTITTRMGRCGSSRTTRTPMPTTSPIGLAGPWKGALFLLFDAGQRQRLFSNIAEAMQGVPDFLVERQLAMSDKLTAG